MDKYYINCNQISDSYDDYKHSYPKYGKSTTDPTYYEPSATRIANMKRASGVQLEGIYDFYSKDDVSKFNATNFDKNISNASIDPRFNTYLLKEEISQATNELGNSVEKMINSKTDETKKRKERITETVEAAKIANSVDDSSDSSSQE